MTNEYRVVTDRYNGFEVQIRRWWLPIWFQCWRPGYITNTFCTLEEAETFALEHAAGTTKKVGDTVKSLGHLPSQPSAGDKS